MKILLIGSCRDIEFEYENYQRFAEEIGKAIAKRGHELISGRAGGMQGAVADSYKLGGGKKWTVYLAKGEENEKFKEATASPDNIIKTDYNYPLRNAFYVGECDAVIALSGLSATLAEIIHAVHDYHKKVWQINIGENVDLIPKMSRLRGKVLISNELQNGFDFLENL